MRLQEISERDLTLLLAKQLGPWSPPDITIFIQMIAQELTGACNLGRFFYTKGIF